MRKRSVKLILLFGFLSALPFMLFSCASTPYGITANQDREKPLLSDAESSWTEQAKNIDELAAKLAEKLDKAIALYGKKIQISENNFLELDTNLNLPFSRHLSEALATSISRYYAKVTVQEVGEEPLRLFGKYTSEKNHLKVTVRLRKMGQIACEDIVVSGNISNTGLEEKWFKPDFSRVANTLVNILEENYHGSESHLSVSVEALRPGIYGQKPLALGESFRKNIVSALSYSPLFRSSAISPGISHASVIGTYEKLGEKIRFHLILTDQSDRTTSASFMVQQHDIPAELMKEVFFIDENPSSGLGNLWIMIQPKNRAFLSGTDKRFSDESSGLINNFFTKHGYKISLNKQQAKLRLVHSLTIERKKGGSNYVGVLQIKLKIRVISVASRALVSEKNGKISLKYSKTMNQFDKNEMVSDVLPKLTEAVCKAAASVINTCYTKNNNLGT